MLEDEETRPKPRRLALLPLDLLGVEELRDYVGELRDEIARVEAEGARKQAHRAAVDSFFKTPG